MTSSIWNFLGSMVVNANQFIHTGLGIVPDGSFLSHQIEAVPFKKLDEFAELHGCYRGLPPDPLRMISTFAGSSGAAQTMQIRQP